MKQQQGFTLIELVVVIVILGLLAATALPKFINITSDARVASIQGVAGGLRAAAALGQAQYVVNGNNTATSISMGGVDVTVLSGDSVGGRPIANATGIIIAMPSPDGYIPPLTNTDSVLDTSLVYEPESGGNATCRAVYIPANPDPVTVLKDGC